MKTLNDKEFNALNFAYVQGYTDALCQENHFDKVVANWLGILEEEDKDDDE